jgi:uncharacterized protein with PQ loop repeat
MTAVLGFLAAVLSIAVVWPQVWRSCRHRSTLGLSPTSTWLGVALNLNWLTFAVLIANTPQIVSNVVVGAANTAVLVALLATQPHLRTQRVLVRTASGAAGLAALAAGSVLAVVYAGAHPAAVAGTLSSVICLVGAAAALPQPLRLLRDRTQDVSGLSPARWALGAASSATWVTYGWLIDQPALCAAAGVGLLCALLVCAVLRSRRTAPAAAATVPAPRRPRTPTRRFVAPVAGCRIPAPRAALVAA